MAYQARAELAAAQGEVDKALSCLVAAQRAFLGVNHQYEVARCLTAMAKLRLERQAPGDIELVRIAQLEAQHIFEQLGAI
jgi:hypothetical protein